jgi:hypothetical protein
VEFPPDYQLLTSIAAGIFIVTLVTHEYFFTTIKQLAVVTAITYETFVALAP